MQRVSTVAAALFCLAASQALAVTPQEAQALLGSQDWQAAQAAYSELVKSEPKNAAYHFSLARAEQGLKNHSKAIAGYRKALSLGYEPKSLVHLQIARCHAAEGDSQKALAELEKLAETRNGPYTTGPSSRGIVRMPEFAGLLEEPRFKAVVERMTPCNLAEHRQFDFWAGYWEIHMNSPDGPLWGNNHIKIVNDGCTLHESAASSGAAYIGQSFSFYDAQLKGWRQTWIDALGFPLYLEGGLDESGAMVMTDSVSTPGTINRITWSPLPDGPRHRWEVSTDNGATWTTTFDGYYKKAEPPSDQ